MGKIESLYYQLDKLPNSIQTALSELDPAKPNNPFFMSIETKEGNFFCLNWDVILFDEKYNTNEKKAQIQPYVAIYAKSFNNGYNDFSIEIKKQATEIFSPDNESISKAIFVRTKKKKGLLSHCFNSELSNERCLEFGKLAGEYYKAWELILKNPTQFECFFDTMTETTPPPKKINITLPKIDDTKFDAKWIYETYIKDVFKCSEECFNSWLKDGKPHPETIEFTLKGREGKPAIAQLRKFIETITGDTINTKDVYYKTVFGLEFKTAHYRTATNLNDTFKDLKKKIDESKFKK